ncbi:MAG: hypothetical protein DWQ02_19370 [Bacteroidetes bacterium]|nr:MAG: hypothetical protein DWQ02_19370 [Bacteroidota bacterium]
MKKKHKHIEEEVRKTMEMTDHIQQVEGNPFLTTRVLQQIENEKAEQNSFFGKLSPAYKLAFSLVLIALNVVVFLQSDGFSNHSAQASDSSFNIANEYGLVSEDSYELSYSYLQEK